MEVRFSRLDRKQETYIEWLDKELANRREKGGAGQNMCLSVGFVPSALIRLKQ